MKVTLLRNLQLGFLQNNFQFCIDSNFESSLNTLGKLKMFLTQKYVLNNKTSMLFSLTRIDLILASIIFQLLLAPLNGITVKGIIRLMGSNWPRSIKSLLYLNSKLCVQSIFGYCYHSVNEISEGLGQGDPIKRHPLNMFPGLKTHCIAVKYLHFITGNEMLRIDTFEI